MFKSSVVRWGIYHENHPELTKKTQTLELRGVNDPDGEVLKVNEIVARVFYSF